MRSIRILVALALLLPLGSVRAQTPADTARALHLLERTTWGARPEDLAEVLRVGRDAWLERQLHPERIADDALEARLAAFPAAAMEPEELVREFPPPQLLRRQLGLDRAAAPGPTTGGDSAGAAARRDLPPELRRELQRRSPQRVAADLVGAKLARAVYSERQLAEVMADFWFNHFNVFFGKNQLRYLTSAYEREAIRPHVFGTLEEMLVATARHPAMLVYLDNWTSVAPDSLRPEQAERREPLRRRMRQQPARNAARRERGINENYARELLELHTLGVDGGYTQQDVVALARILTGWTTTPVGPRAGGAAAERRETGFHFRPQLHDRGEKILLGHAFPAGRGEEEGIEALHLLATHPATARHIARKLAERFVADDPPEALVERLAGVFLETGGDLRALTHALFTAPEFYDTANVRSKVKTPLHFVASALRAADAELIRPSRTLLQALRAFGHTPYLESAPIGYPATKEEWVNSGAMLSRMNLALELGAGRVDGVRVDPRRLLGPAPGDDAVAAVAAHLLPGSDTRALRELVSQELASDPGIQPHQKLGRAAGLVLGSPEFQRY